MSKRSEQGGRGIRFSFAKIARVNSQMVWAVSAFLLVFAVFFVSFVPPQVRVQVGQVSPMDVRAPQEVIDDAATQKLRDERSKSVPKAYDSDPKVLSDLKTQISSFRAKIAEIAASSSVSTQSIVQSLRPFLSQDVSDADIIAAVAASPQVLETSCAHLDQMVSETLAAGLRPEDVAKAKEDLRTEISRDKEIPDQIGRVLMSFVSKNLKANLTLNQEETDRRIKEALSSVEPVRIRRGQLIVREGDVVTKEQMDLLVKLGMTGSWLRLAPIVGSAMMSVFMCGLTFAYLRLHHPDVLSGPKVGLAASVLMLSMLATKVFAAVSPFLAPTAAGAMLAATLFDRRFGTFFGVCLALAAGVMSGFDLASFPLSLAGVLVAALAVKPDWNRMRLLRAGLIVSAVDAGVYLTLGLTGAVPLTDLLVWRNSLTALVNGPFSAVLAVGSLPLFEAAFGIITPLRLIELSNPENPLLHRLLLEAPGTYHHSIMVGNLAEAAAMAIGADSLLARVGAYYHDIGKVKRPYFFSENQVPGMDNPHDKMSPSLSATVITSHVKDGLELAAEHGVPNVIRDFIAEHHGTMLASFFYSKASEMESKDNRSPEEWDFRYEGPRPTTKEVAVVMLADGVEAATRSLSKPTPARVESVVRKIIQDRLLDHQLDKSDLTLRELDVVADTFTKVLSGVFHTRVEYPDKVRAGQ